MTKVTQKLDVIFLLQIFCSLPLLFQNKYLNHLHANPQVKIKYTLFQLMATNSYIFFQSQQSNINSNLFYFEPIFLSSINCCFLFLFVWSSFGFGFYLILCVVSKAYQSIFLRGQMLGLQKLHQYSAT